MKLWALRVRNTKGSITTFFDEYEEVLIEIEYEILKPMPQCRVGVIVTSPTYGLDLFMAHDADLREYQGPREPGRYISTCVIPSNLLAPGGFLLSVNAGIPGLTRQQLTAVPISEWEREKDRFVYEKWMEHALAAAGKPAGH